MPIKTLVVDDHDLVRAGLRLHLEREPGIEVIADAPDAATAWAVIEEKSPDLVLMDIELPGEDGLVATTTIKKRWPRTRVVLLTGRKPTHVAQAALLAGADGLVFKSETSEHLLRAVRTAAAGQVYLSPVAATALATTLRDSARATEAAPELSVRERAVLKGLAEGLSYKELAAALGVSVKSVDTYRSRLTKKLGCSGRAELIRSAMRLGLTSG